MRGSDTHLLRSRRFLPLFITQFLGAFNDNLFKQALIILITYYLASDAKSGQLLVTAAGGIFILPFFLFSATAGQLADKFDKATLSRLVKIAEIILAGLACAGFYLESVPLLMLVLFLLGAQSAFFGPIKYSILPQHLREHELLSGNALVEAGTFIAILTGTILAGLIIVNNGGHADTSIVCALLVFFAVVGYMASRAIPTAEPADPALKIEYNIFRETWKIVGFARQKRSVFLSILGISWFWFVGSTFLMQFPNLSKHVLGANEHVLNLFLTVFSVGIAIGSIWCNRLLKGKLQATYVPASALGMTLFGLDLYFVTSSLPVPVGGYIMTLSDFFGQAVNWRILLDMLGLSICGGLYIVPLYAIMQHDSDSSFRSRVVASNNIMNALFMVCSAIMSAIMLASGFTVPEVFLTIAIINLFTAVYICRLLPDAVMRSLVRWLLMLLYRVELKGKENFAHAGNRVLVIANHTSFLDAALIAAFLPEKLTFAVNTHIAQRWWMRPLLALVDTFPIDPTNPMATKSLIDLIKHDKKCMIFPEGRITVTGSLMKVYEGPGMIADKSAAMMLPIRIDGAQYTPLSRLKGKVRLRWFPKVTITVLPPRRFEVDETLKGRIRRQAISAKLYDVMTEMMFDSSDWKRPLFSSVLDAASTHGYGHIIAEDVERKPITYRQLIARSFILGRVVSKLSKRGDYIGVLLPNMVSTIITFFALQAFGRVPAMLNFSAGAANIASACSTAKLAHVLTSHRFVGAANLTDAIHAIEATGAQVVYLEDLREKITTRQKLLGMIAAYVAPEYYAGRYMSRDHTHAAVVLFTSGSEGTPKGVVLSHANIQANRFQLSARVDFGPQDSVFNCLPVFHSFGLTGGTLLPLLSGLRTFFYPSPLHYRIVPELVYDTNATILFGTDTFLAGYAKFAHPYDFHNLRYVFAGAEKLKETTRKIYSEKFGVRIFEGYGATETSPVISTNTPMQSRTGTVGRLMPGLTHSLKDVPGITEGGQLHVRGPNIMLGYLLSSAPGELLPPHEGWYDTGDIVSIDAEGYITIQGRTKRFAKIGGEMVSLSAVESYANAVWPNQMHAAVSLPDDKKGEQVILLTQEKSASREQLLAYAREAGISELYIPKTIIHVELIPLLGTGKTDYVATKQLASERMK